MQAKAQLFITFSCSSSCACVRVKHKQQKHGLSQNTPLLPPLLNGFFMPLHLSFWLNYCPY